MFLLAVTLAVAVGLLRRGSLRAFGDVRFNLWALVVVAFGLRYGLSWAGSRGWTAIVPAAPAIHLASYALLLYALWCNRRLPGDWLLLAGSALNAAVIAANGGRMPVMPAAVVAIGQAGQIPRLAHGGDDIHSLMSATTRLPWLGDRFVLPLLGRSVFSLGDVVIVVGLFILVQGIMLGRGRRRPASPA